MKVKTLSGIWVEANERDSQWIQWIEEYGVSDESLKRFLELHPTISETIEESEAT